MSLIQEAYDEATYDDAYDDAYDEAAPSGFRPKPFPTARPTPPPSRPTDRPVTQTQLETAIGKLNRDITRNSGAIDGVNKNLNNLGRDVRRVSNRSRSTRKDIAALRDAIVMLPLLSSALDTSDNPLLGALFPMLFTQGIGTDNGDGNGDRSSSSGGLFGGGGGDMSMFMVLALTGRSAAPRRRSRP